MLRGLFTKRDKEPEGYIDYFKLNEWWQDNFTEQEKTHMVKTFQPMGASKDILVKGKFDILDNSPLSFLTSLSGWFDNPRDRELAHKIISKAEELVDFETNILNLHFFYPTKMKLFYKDRDTNPKSLATAVDFCLKQIAIAEKAAVAFRKEYEGSDLPTHEGYDQLCIILEKQEKFNDAIKYATQAREQGWRGDWNKRIERCKKRSENVISK